MRAHNLQKPPPPPDREAALERQWAFSSASEGQRLGTIALGVANLVGVLFLGNLLADPAVGRALAQSSLGFMAGLLPFLQACAPCPWKPILWVTVKLTLLGSNICGVPSSK